MRDRLKCVIRNKVKQLHKFIYIFKIYILPKIQPKENNIYYRNKTLMLFLLLYLI